jgi:hypothetical protein
MPPKAVSLAYAGRKLTGPPEGYGKKKELQVKQWIQGLPRPDEAELVEVASVATLAEVRQAPMRAMLVCSQGPAVTSTPPEVLESFTAAFAGYQLP